LASALNLEPHPEGGWNRRTWASPVSDDVSEDEASVRRRATATVIIFLLPPGESSAWHKVASAETWIWNGLGSIVIDVGGTGTSPTPEQRTVLGGDLAVGEQLQVHIPAGVWQRTIPSDHSALASCVVSPGFDFADFQLE
ncbi:MAG: Cupin, partial [Glaciihabitans sp.]|nr:Cupin [Glaciihabitans sp.]